MALVVKNLLSNAGDIRDTGSIPGLGRCPEGGHGSPLQYSCLEIPMGYSQEDDKVSNITEVTEHVHVINCIKF